MNFLGFLQSLLGGIGTGTIYALLGLSCSLILGRLQICSVVHGDLTILAGYLCYQAFRMFGINSTLFPYRILDTEYFYETIYEAGNMERTL